MYSRIPNRWPLRAPVSSSAFRPWLIARTSLTLRLRRRCAKFSVREVKQRMAKPHLDELRAMRLPMQGAMLIREVMLYCGNTPVVYARSILPRASLIGPWARLGKLGNKPLGHVLFSDPRVQRTPFRYRKFRRGDAMQSAALPRCRDALWGRYSVFRLHGQPIMVSEVFLPAILDLPA